MADATTPDEIPGTRPRRRWGRRALILLGVLLLGTCATSTWIEHAGRFEPPELPAGHPAFALTVTRDVGGIDRCGSAWLHTDEGIGELFLAGDDITRGFTAGSLTIPALRLQEDALVRELDRVAPSGLRRSALRKLVLFVYRDLPDYVDDSFERELAALSRGQAAAPPHALEAEFPHYHRSFFYQTLYDTGQAMAEAGLVDAAIGCTSFAASGDATRGGGLIVARNCDFEAGAVFDERKLMMFVAPDVGQRFVHVSWSGMVGVVSGVNESGLVVMLHAARTERTRYPRVGCPVPMILRDALLHDRTIEDVTRRFRESPDHAAAMIVVAETASGRSAVIETDADHTAVVESRDDVTLCANFLRSPAWADDEIAGAARRFGSSPARFARMKELVAAGLGRIDPPLAVNVLRDGAGLEGADIGLGNRTAISALIVAHAVVYDGAARRLYVGRAPRGLGAFVGYELGPFFDGADPGGPAEVRMVPDATSIGPAEDVGAADRVATGRKLLRDAGVVLGQGDASRALESATQAAELLERSPEALVAVARALAALGRAEEARDVAAEALARQPVPGPELAELQLLAAPDAD